MRIQINQEVNKMEDEIKFKDYIPLYPDMSSDNIQQDLYGLGEFYKLRAREEAEGSVKKGDFYRHQILTQRLTDNTDSLFIIQDVSTGKTCTIAAIAEMAKRMSPYIKKCYYVTSNKLEESVRHQMLCSCTGDRYLTEKVISAGNKSKKSQSNQITRSVGKWYEILTYGELTNLLKGFTSEYISRVYSGHIFNLDEVHNIVSMDLDDKISKEDKENRKKMEEFRKSNIVLSIDNIDSPQIRDSDIYYVQVWRLYHCVKRSIRLLTTATPMINYPVEMSLLCNLLLPEDNQMPLNIKFERTNMEFYKRWFKSMFSYIRSPDIGAYPLFKGRHLTDADGNIKMYEFPRPVSEIDENTEYDTQIIESQTIVYRVEMIKTQAEVFYEKYKHTNDSLLASETQISSFVTEEGKFGANIKVNKALLKDLTFLREHSVKYYNILMDELGLYESTDGKPGCCFISGDKVEGSGLITLRDIFVAHGYSILDIAVKFDTTSDDLCVGSIMGDINLSKGKRIAFLTSSTDRGNEKIREQVIQFFSEESNKFGEYCQILLASDVAKEGVNTKNITRYRRINPGWHEPGMYQVQNRVFRTEAFTALKKYISERDGIPVKDVTIDVDMYNYSALGRYFYVPDDVTDKEYSFIKKYKNTITRRDERERFYSNELIVVRLDEVDYFNDDTPPTEFNKTKYDPFNEYFDFLDNTKFYYTDMDKNSLINVNKYIKSNTSIILNMYVNGNNGYYLFSDDGLIPLEYEVLSSDIDMYERSEDKNIVIRKIMRYAKQYAIDCKLNKARSYKKSDLDYSPECDYQVCKYQCYSEMINPSSNEDILPRDQISIDWTNYHLHYSEDAIQQCNEEIVDKIISNESMTISSLKRYLKDNGFSNYVINTSLYDVIYNRKKMKDRFGNSCYITTNIDTIFLQREFPVDVTTDPERVNTGIYIDKITGLDVDTSLPFDNSEDMDKIENFIMNNNYRVDSIDDLTDEEYNNLMEDIRYLIKSLKNRISRRELLEKSVEMNVNNEGNIKTEAVQDFFKLKLFEIDDNGNNVIVHNQERFNKNTKYAALSNLSKPSGHSIRVLKNDDGRWVWKNPNKYEKATYTTEIARRIKNKVDDYMERTPYNFIITFIDDIYRKTDKKKSSKGSIIKDKTEKEKLVAIAKQMGIDDLKNKNPFNEIINKANDEEIVLYFDPII